MTRYRNAAIAFTHVLSRLAASGDCVRVRNNNTRELLSELIEIDNPSERCIVLPGRNNNVFATIAETMWVLAGRNDIAFLDGYLRSARDFSDDGTTWRAAYGPRLRSWNGVDQLAAVRRILIEDPNSRRAVISLFDPDRDFVASNDIPCNNWIHFLIRGEKLHMNVAARSSDLVWGFSGINAFEWTVLQEMLAFWLDVEVGDFRFFASSMHLYERHYELPSRIDPDSSQTIYSDCPARVSFSTQWGIFDDSLQMWMAAEAAIRRGETVTADSLGFSDPLLLQFIQMIDIYWTYKRGGSREGVNDKIAALGGTDLAIAAQEFVDRTLQ